MITLLLKIAIWLVNLMLLQTFVLAKLSVKLSYILVMKIGMCDLVIFCLVQRF